MGKNAAARANRASLNRYQVSQRPKASVADAAHDDQMLGAAKRPVLLAVLDDPRRDGLANAGQLLQFLSGSGVDIYSLRVLLTRNARFVFR